MEAMLFLLGILTVLALIGGLVGFFSLFGNKQQGDSKAIEKIETLERELTSIKQRLRTLETAEKNTATENKANSAQPSSPALKTVPLENKVSAPETLAMPEQSIDDTELTRQALANSAADSEPIKPRYTPPPIQPLAPNILEKGIIAAKDWLLGGNTLVRSGIVILFLGVAFLLKFAADNNFIPIELRLAAVALLGAGLLAFGWKQKDQRKEYAWALQGGGIGVLYLTIFATFKLYHLLPAGIAFGLLIAVAFLSAAIAVLQSAMPLAVLGFAGGFLAPIFTSTGHGSHVGLFSYYLVLNLAIAFVAFYRSWRPLNVLGFAFTFIIGTLWGTKSYIPEHFASTEPFLIAHFLLFTAIAVLYAHRQATKASDYVDATLVFGTPIVGFSLQYALLRDSQFGLAYSALALGIFYIALAWWVLARQKETLKFLGECFLALGAGFMTLTLPLALDGRWTSAAWAVEGVGLLWVGLKQHRVLPTLSGLVLQLLAAIAFSQGWGLTSYADATHQNLFLGVAFIALAGWACGALINAYRPNRLGLLTTALAMWGWAWWTGAGITAVDAFVPHNTENHAVIIFMALTSLLLPMVARYFKWPKLAGLACLLLPVLALAALIDTALVSFDRIAPSYWFGWLAWPLGIGAYAWLVARNAVPQKAWLRAPIIWIAALIGVLEWQHHLGYYVYESAVWHEIGWAVVPMLLVGGLYYWLFAKNKPEDMQAAHTWGWGACAPIMLFLIGWFIWMSLNSSGYAAPLPYLPLVNPLDITLSAVLLLFLLWQRAIGKNLGKRSRITPVLASLMGFSLLNGMLLRTLHHWLGTPFEWTSLFNYPQVQMAFTFLWGITAFILMMLAHKRAQRVLWMAGAALMGLVVAKIFLLDLAQHGSVERIVSFIGAGMMLLVMGYFAPLPPAKAATANEKETA